MRYIPAFVSAFTLIAGAIAASAQQPVTITTSDDFRKGNNEGLVIVVQDELARAPVSAGTLGGWTNGTDLPFGRIAPAVVYGGRVYLFGGSPDGYSVMDDAAYASLNADGSVGAWNSATPLNTARGAHGAVAYNGFVYAIGGSTDFTDTLTSVEFAPVNADGSIGNWSETASLPSGRLYHSCFAHNGFIYTVGGLNSSGVGFSEVLYAPIRADGSLGAWTETTELPGPRLYHSTVAYGGFVFVIAGTPYDGADPYGDSLAAAINADGTLGSWTSTTGLQADRRWQACTALDGFVYAVGGYDSSGAMAGVDAAPINPDGTLGSWSPVASIPSGRLFATAVASHGFLYAFGGFDNDFSLPAEVLFTPIDADSAGANQDPDRLLSIFSQLLDLEADSPSRSILLEGVLAPGGLIKLQVRVAPEASGIFGAETVVDPATPGVPIEVAGSGRYVWISVTLDDTGSSDVDQPTTLTDITVSPFSPPTAGTVSDGSGPDIDTQSSTSTIKANWSGFAGSPGDALASYEWAIGTAPGSTNLQPWTNVGLATTATNSSLNLSAGMKFVSVRAVSASGLKSVAATSDGVQVQASAGAPPGDDGGKKGRCEQGASADSAPGVAILAGLLLLAGAACRRRS